MKQTIGNLLTIFLVFTFCSTGLALTLDEARAQKLVVEKPNGFIEAKDPKAKDLAKTVNSKRKAAYEKVAKKTRTSIDVVGAQAHKKIMKSLGK